MTESEFIGESMNPVITIICIIVALYGGWLLDGFTGLIFGGVILWEGFIAQYAIRQWWGARQAEKRGEHVYYC